MRDWVQAARLRTLPLAAATAMVGAALAARAMHKAGQPLDNRFWGTFVGVLLTVWVLQVLSNFANDYGDAEHGADGAHRTDRAVASGRIAPQAMKRAIVLTAVKDSKVRSSVRRSRPAAYFFLSMRNHSMA